MVNLKVHYSLKFVSTESTHACSLHIATCQACYMQHVAEHLAGYFSFSLIFLKIRPKPFYQKCVHFLLPLVVSVLDMPGSCRIFCQWWKCWAPQSQTICLLLFCCFSYCRVFLWLSPLHSSSLHSSMMHFLYFLWKLRFNSHLFLFCLQASIWLQVLNYRFFPTFLQDTTTASIENTLMSRSINSIGWTRGSSTQPGPTSWKSQRVLQMTARSLPPESSGPRTVSFRRMRTSKSSLKGSCTNSAAPNNFSSIGTAPPGQRKFTKFLFHTFQVALRS